MPTCVAIAPRVWGVDLFSRNCPPRCNQRQIRTFYSETSLVVASTESNGFRFYPEPRNVYLSLITGAFVAFIIFLYLYLSRVTYLSHDGFFFSHSACDIVYTYRVHIHTRNRIGPGIYLRYACSFYIREVEHFSANTNSPLMKTSSTSG